MKYLSAKEIGAIWGISERRVQKLCEDNRIAKVQRLGKSWAIPRNAQKPLDARHDRSNIKLDSDEKV